MFNDALMCMILVQLSHRGSVDEVNKIQLWCVYLWKLEELCRAHPASACTANSVGLHNSGIRLEVRALFNFSLLEKFGNRYKWGKKLGAGVPGSFTWEGSLLPDAYLRQTVRRLLAGFSTLFTVEGRECAVLVDFASGVVIKCNMAITASLFWSVVFESISQIGFHFWQWGPASIKWTWILKYSNRGIFRNAIYHH